MSRVKLLIFDMDGLMIDTERTYGRDMVIAYLKRGIHCDPEPLWEIIGTSLPLDFERMNLDHIDPEEFRRILFESHEESIAYMNAHGIPIKKGLLRLMNKAREKGIRMAVGTSTSIRISGQYLENSGLIDYLDFIVTRDEVEKGKPEPDIFLKCCEKAGVLPEEALVLEDTNNGCLAAYNGNIPYIMVPDILTPDSFVREHAVAVVESLEDVIRYI